MLAEAINIKRWEGRQLVQNERKKSTKESKVAPKEHKQTRRRKAREEGKEGTEKRQPQPSLILMSQEKDREREKITLRQDE